tara:strand:- start:670 stop:1044 length:375 start_codon:yes stop_codon:yes gene_type:complete
VDSIKGDISLENGNGSAGPATITVNPYGYQSVGLDTLLEPTSKWIVEMYRGDMFLGSISSDSSNASSTGRIGLPDGGGQYGNAIYWRQLIPTDQVKLGDKWIVYGWNNSPVVSGYPPDREYIEP